MEEKIYTFADLITHYKDQNRMDVVGELEREEGKVYSGGHLDWSSLHRCMFGLIRWDNTAKGYHYWEELHAELFGKEQTNQL